MKKKNLIILLLIPFIIGLLAVGSNNITRIVLANELVDIEWDYKDVEDFELTGSVFRLLATPKMRKKTSEDNSNLLMWKIENVDKTDETEYAKVYLDSDGYWYIKPLVVTGVKEVIVSCYGEGGVQKSMRVVIWNADNPVFVVNPVISSSQSNIDSTIYYGEYDIVNNIKENAKIAFNIEVYPISLTSFIEIVDITDNISLDLSSGEVNIKSSGDAYFKLGLSKEGLIEPTTYKMMIVEDGVNVYNYSDLLYCTNYSKTGEIVVLRKSLESLENAYKLDNSGNVMLDDNGNPVTIKNNVDLFGSYNVKKKTYYFEDEIYKFTTTYNKNYIDQWNDYITSKGGKNYISDKVSAGIRVQKDFYGNGYSLNLHNLTFPSGKITSTINGEEYVIPTLSPRDLYRGPLPFYTLGDHNGLALVEAYGQDNIGVYVDGDNITINDVNIRSCDVGSFMSNLETVGTTLETHGENITIKNSKLSNGKTIIRSFSSMNTVIDNCLLSTAYNFLISVGSNEYISLDEDTEYEFTTDTGEKITSTIKEYFKRSETEEVLNNADSVLNRYLTNEFSDKNLMKTALLSLQNSFNQKNKIEGLYKGSITINDTYLHRSNIASIAIESMFNGPFLYSYIPTSISNILGLLESTDGTKLSEFKPTNLSGLSFPVKVEVSGSTKFYDYKAKDELDISGLIKENISSFAGQIGGADYSGIINIDKIFPIKEYLFSGATSSLYNDNGKEYINIPVAFYGGGLNLSTVSFDTLDCKAFISDSISIDLLDNYLSLGTGSGTIQVLKNMMLKSVTVVIGFEPFKFICMDNTGYLYGETPNLSDLIENAKGEK